MPSVARAAFTRANARAKKEERRSAAERDNDENAIRDIISIMAKKKETYPVSVSRYKCISSLESAVEKFANLKILGYRFKRRIYIAYDLRSRKNGLVRETLKWEKTWADCRVTLRKPPRFPWTEEINVGSVQVRKGLDQALTGKTWFYETEKVVFRDYDEMAAFGFGWAAFVVLRKAAAIPGRLTRTGRAKKAVEWLNEFKAWKDAGYPAGAVTREPPKEIGENA